MKGKIFPESSNIYQDQAKILFNYYQQMAEKIVYEEERIEKEIAGLEEEKKMFENLLSNFWTRLKLWFQGKLKKTRLEVESLKGRIVEFGRMHNEIFRDYKVTKLGVAYVPIADQIKYENKSFMIDHTGMVEESEVKLQLSRQNDLLIQTIAELDGLSKEAPIIEGSDEMEEIDTDHYSRSMQQLNQHDYFGKLERSLRTISYCMDDLDITSVDLPLVANDSSYLNFVKEYATHETPPGVPVFKVFDSTKYNDQIAKFQELNRLKDSLSSRTAQFEDVLRGLMVTMANSVQAISALKIASTDKIIFESNKILYKILKSPYNHYSPMLEASEIERIRNESFNYGEAVSDYVPFQLKDSSKVKFNLISGMWTAEDGSTTNFPFGVHQIHEEIVAPIVQNLMNETRLERLKIYNHIKDQKISYLNKWHQDTDDFYGRNRAESANLINLMRASLRDYVAAYNTLNSLKKTEDSMSQSGGSLDSTVVTAIENTAETFAAFEVQSKEFQNVQTEFEAYMERLKEDIELKAAKFEHIDYYDALLRDGNSRDTAVAAHDVHDLDVRRKPLISVNPLFAKISDLPPTPSIEDLTYEHISLNLPVIAKNTLMELDEDLLTENYSHDEKASEIDIELSEEELPEDASETEVGQNPEENITNSLADEGGIQEVDQQEEPDGEDMAGADEMRNDETDEWLEEEGEEDAEAREDEDYEDDDKRIASFKQSLNEDEILVRVKLTDKIEKWKISDWEEVVKAGNEDKFEIL
jgi:ASC-1-like (ASCH) protein